MNSSQKPRLRYAVIGVAAGVFFAHYPALQLEPIELVAVSDINISVGQERAQELGCAFYPDYAQLLAEVHPDVVVILTPHLFHAPIAIDCLRAGSHVLVEKPVAIQVAEADAMIEAANQSERLLGVIFQHRFRSEIRTAYRLIHENQLGTIQHVNMTAFWTRPASYFQQAPWRGTWAGEGGGILMNQAAHNLDVLCHLLGRPKRVFGWSRTLLHKIETEDTIQAFLEWPEGALGSVHISTAEADLPETLKIIGTKGSLEIKDGGMTFRKLETDLKEYMETETSPFAVPQAEMVDLEMEDSQGDHVAVYRNFNEAILHGSAFLSPGIEGRMSLELANSLIYSSHKHSEVELPLDPGEYATLLDMLRKGSV